MWDINDFIEEYYSNNKRFKDNEDFYYPDELITYREFKDWKEEFGIEEEVFNLEDYKYLAAQDVNVVPVRFMDCYQTGYSYWFCEVPEDYEEA